MLPVAADDADDDDDDNDDADDDDDDDDDDADGATAALARWFFAAAPSAAAATCRSASAPQLPHALLSAAGERPVPGSEAPPAQCLDRPQNGV
jgi:hypothetical protein